jgi:hypothetical protein
LSATIVILSGVIVSGCDDGPQDQPTVHFWESYVGAAERFIRAEHAFELAFVEDFARYASNVINDRQVYADDFKLARKFNPRTPLLVFRKTPQGAYLLEGDNTYLERIQEQLGKELQEKKGTVDKRLSELREVKAPQDASLRSASLFDDFRSMPALVSTIERMKAEELRPFSLALRRELEGKSIDASVVSSFFRRPAGYRGMHEENKDPIVEAAFDAAKSFMPSMRGKYKLSAVYEDNFRSFLVAEAVYGLEGYRYTMLVRKGLYAVLGEDSLRRFRKSLRDALAEAAPHSS